LIKKERNKGWGVVLVKALINKSRLLNIIPTAVCEVNNITSRKTLQKAGFHLDGCILSASFHNTII
jgi:FR47-like protein.